MWKLHSASVIQFLSFIFQSAQTSHTLRKHYCQAPCCCPHRAGVYFTQILWMSEKEGVERHAVGEMAGASPHPWPMSLRTPSLKRAAVSFLSSPHCMISLTISFDHSLSQPPLSFFEKTFLRLFIIDSEIISASFKVVNNSHPRYLSSEYQRHAITIHTNSHQMCQLPVLSIQLACIFRIK